MANGKSGLLSRQNSMAKVANTTSGRAEPMEFDGVDLSQLKPKMRQFAKYQLETFNIAESARRAGYAESTGYRLMAREDIGAYQRMLVDQTGSDGVATELEVIQYLSSVMRGELSEEVILQSGKKLEKVVAATDRTAAANLLGKYYGTFVDRVEVQKEVNIVVDIDSDYADLIESEESGSLEFEASFEEVDEAEKASPERKVSIFD